MAYQHYRSPFGDTTFTKVFVGGLAWETPTEEMRKYFQKFGDILEAVIITDKNTGKSKGYGFVTFRDPDSARQACADPNPMIDGRRANCNIASFGRPRPSPPRGRNQGGGSYHGGAQSASSSYSGVTAPSPPPPPPPPPPLPPPSVIYPPYGYATYTPDYGYQQNIYNPQLQQPQYYHQPYGTSSSSIGSPYYYGYSLQPSRGSFYAPQAHRIQGPPYYYYPTQVEGPSTFSPPPLQLPRHALLSSPDTQNIQRTTSATEAEGISSESPKT